MFQVAMELHADCILKHMDDRAGADNCRKLGPDDNPEAMKKLDKVMLRACGLVSTWW